MTATDTETTIVNIFGGPGAGKSTLALGIAHRLKKLDRTCELITEAAKVYAYLGENIGPREQMKICSEQMDTESQYYGLVEFLVTDSPLELQAFYDVQRTASPAYRVFIHHFRKETHQQFRMRTINLFIPRVEDMLSYDNRGRYQDYAAAVEIDDRLIEYLRYTDMNKVVMLADCCPVAATTEILLGNHQF